MEKWEHCVIASEGAGSFGLCRVIYYMTSTGFRRQVIAERYKAGNRADVLRKIDGPAIAQLGNEGWQLVRISDKSGWYFFKRRVA